MTQKLKDTYTARELYLHKRCEDDTIDLEEIKELCRIKTDKKQ